MLQISGTELGQDAADTSAVNTDTNIRSEELQIQGEPGDSEAAKTLPATGLDPTITTDTKTTLHESQNAEEDTANETTKAPSTEVKILTPTPDTVLDIPASAVTVQFAVGSQVELKVNGVVVDSSLIGRTETDDSTKSVTQTWYGVGLQQGENTITAQVTTMVVQGLLQSRCTFEAISSNSKFKHSRLEFLPMGVLRLQSKVNC